MKRYDRVPRIHFDTNKDFAIMRTTLLHSFLGPFREVTSMLFDTFANVTLCYITCHCDDEVDVKVALELY